MMNYIGSKHTLLPFLESVTTDVAGEDLSDKVFCDLFAGTGAVGRAFKPKVKKVIANDREYYSYVLNRNYIGNSTDLEGKEERLARLDLLTGDENGFIYRNYCKGSGSGRQYFSDENGKKTDAVRTRIEEWREKGDISEDMYFFLLASLLESADRYANTASVYGAFLKHLKASARKKLTLTPAVYTKDGKRHEVYCADANELIKDIEGDILYLDPPYNARQYGANYHLLNTIAEYKPFTPKGKTGLRNYEKSPWCAKKTVLSCLESLIRDARFRYIFLSYNNEGLMSLRDIENTMSRYGHYRMYSQEYQRFRADKKESRNHLADKTTEYLHVLKKTK